MVRNLVKQQNGDAKREKNEQFSNFFFLFLLEEKMVKGAASVKNPA